MQVGVEAGVRVAKRVATNLAIYEFSFRSMGMGQGYIGLASCMVMGQGEGWHHVQGQGWHHVQGQGWHHVQVGWYDVRGFLVDSWLGGRVKVGVGVGVRVGVKDEVRARVSVSVRASLM